MQNAYTLRLEDIDGSQVALGGGKGASLGELVRVGVRVPRGFVVTRPAFDAFMAAADPNRRVPSWVADVDAGRTPVRNTAKAIVDLLSDVCHWLCRRVPLALPVRPPTVECPGKASGTQSIK